MDALILAAGRGTRLGLDESSKMFDTSLKI